MSCPVDHKGPHHGDSSTWTRAGQMYEHCYVQGWACGGEHEASCDDPVGGHRAREERAHALGFDGAEPWENMDYVRWLLGEGGRWK